MRTRYNQALASRPSAHVEGDGTLEIPLPMRPEIPHGCNGMGPLQRLGTEEAYPIYAGIRRRFFRNHLRRRPRSLPCFTLRFLYTSNRGGGRRAYCCPPVL